MKVISSRISSLYKNRCVAPRLFLRVADADLFLGTKSFVDSNGEIYKDKIQNLGAISEDVDWLGGLASVSSLEMQSIELGEQVYLCDVFEITPKLTGSTRGAGRLIKSGAINQSYEDVRNSTTAEYDSVMCVIGRDHLDGPIVETVFRSPLQFVIDSTVTSCEYAYLEFVNNSDNSGETISIEGYLGSWSDINYSFIAFDGYHSSGDYDGTNLLHSWDTSQFEIVYDSDLGKYVTRLRLNDEGRQQIVNAAGGIFKLMLISNRDRDFSNYSTGAIGPEYVMFESSVTLHLRCNSKILDNKELTLYIDYEDDGVLSSTYSTMHPLRTMSIADWNISDNNLSLSLSDGTFLLNPKLPKRIINKVDWPLCPDNNVGKPYPILIGKFELSSEHREGVGNYDFYGPSGEANGSINYSYPYCFKAYVVSKNGDKRTLLLCNNEILYQYNGSLANLNPFFILNSGKRVYSHLLAWDYSLPLSNPGRRYIRPGVDMLVILGQKWETGWRAMCSLLPNDSDSSGVTNPTHAYDSDTDTYAYFPPGAGLHSLTLYFDDLQSVTGTGYGCLIGYVDLNGESALKFTIALFENQKAKKDDTDNWVLISSDNYWTADGQQIMTFYDGANEPLIMGQHKLVFTFDGTTATSGIRLYDVCYSMSHDAADVDEIYSVGEGNIFGAWVDEVGRSNSFDDNDLIENPIFAIEHILRTELSATSAKINCSQFDTYGALLSAWKYAFQICDQNKTEDVLHDIAAQCKSILFNDSTNKWSIRTYDPFVKFNVSGLDTPSGMDIFDGTGCPVGDTLTTNMILPGSLVIDHVDSDYFYNEFELRYKRDIGTKQFREILYMTNGAGILGNVETNVVGTDLELTHKIVSLDVTGLNVLKSLCANAYINNNSRTRRKVIEAWAIADRATASKLLQYHVERCAVRPWRISFKTKFTALNREIGDIINIRDKRIIDTVCGEAEMNLKRWAITRLQKNPDNMEISITTVEVENNYR